MTSVKPDVSTPQNRSAEKGRFGLPGTSKQRKARIRAAIKANRETLRRLAR